MLTVELCGIVLCHPVYYCENVQTFLLGYDVVSATALVIDTEAKCVWSKLTVESGVTQDFTNPTISFTAGSPTASLSTVGSSAVTSSTVGSFTTSPPSTSGPIVQDTFTIPTEYGRLPPCKSPKFVQRRLAAFSGSPTSNGPVTARSTAVTTPNHYATSMSFDPFAPSFSPRFVSTHPSDPAVQSSDPSICPFDPLSAFHPSMLVCPPVDSTSSMSNTMTPSAVPYMSTAVETTPTVSAFSQKEPIEFEFDLETQLKVVKQSAANAVDFDLPLHVNVLFLKTVEDVDLPDETVDDLTLLLKDHQETFASSSADLGYCPLVKHDIDTGDARPIKQSPRRPPICKRRRRRDVGNWCYRAV